MKILQLSTSLEGGAGGAAYGLHQALRDLGVQSRMLVQDNRVGRKDPSVIKARTSLRVQAINRAARGFAMSLYDRPLRHYPNRLPGLFSVQRVRDSILANVEALEPELVHLHWTCGEWMAVETVGRIRQPIVWTCHDAWPFTGGCHNHGDCERYADQCGLCPALGSRRERDVSRRLWQRKAKVCRGKAITVVCCSRWMGDCARASSLFRPMRVEVIPNGISMERFRPINRQAARDMLRLPRDKQIVLFGAWSNLPHKGLHLLTEALGSLSGSPWRGRLELAIFGFGQPVDAPPPGIPTHYLGRFIDPLALALVYSAADVLVVPSTYEPFGLVAVEASACGTPCVAFNTGGLRDIIEHQRSGYLAEPFDPASLAQGIAWVLEDPRRQRQLGQRARKKAAEEFSRELCAQRHRALYEEILADRQARTRRPVAAAGII